MASLCPGFLATLDPALCRPVDHYCERLTAAFDAEPINALTNLAFAIAGWAAWRRFSHRQRPGDDKLLATTILAIPVVGIGSMVFHTVAQRWAEWVDVIPILVFVLLCLWLAMSRLLGWPRPVKVLLLLLYTAATIWLEVMVPGEVLWGGAMHIPTLVALVALAGMPKRYSGRARPALQGVCALFITAVTFRTLDHVVCGLLPTGTHFLWHLLNALLAYIWVGAFLRGDRKQMDAGTHPQASVRLP